jgi:peptide deformylase
MFDTMKDSGGIGIAATQIDVDLQVALIDLPENSDRYKIERPSGLITIINPEIKIINPELQTFWEGCLSVPGLRAPVSRPRGVGLTYMNEEGEKCGLEAHGFMATVIQHELDHLFGTLFVDRVTDNRQLSFESEYEQFHVVKPSE